MYRPPHYADELLPRDAIVNDLTDSTRPLAILLGPPGSGKTALLANLYRQLRLLGEPVQWLSIGDISPTALGDHLQTIAAVQRLEGGPILLDGLERVTEPTARQSLEDFLLNLPDRAKIIASARRLRGARLHDAWLRGHIELISPAKLQFSNEEASSMLGPGWSEQEAMRANGFVEGWAAGLRFLAADPHATRKLLDPSNDTAALPVRLADYFDDVVCAAFEPELLAMLRMLSVAERFSPALLSALPGTVRWVEIDALIRDGAFVRYLDTAHEWAGFHPAFARHLRRTLRDADPQRFEDTRRFSATWFADHGFPADAIRLAVDISDKSSAARIIERAGAISVDLHDGPDVGLDMTIPPEQAGELPLLFLGQVYNRIRHGKYRQARMAYETASLLTEGYTRIDNPAELGAVTVWAKTIEVVFYSIEDSPIPPDLMTQLEAQLLAFSDTHPVLATGIASVLAFAYVDRGHYAEAARVSALGFGAQQADNASKVTLFLDLHHASALIATDSIERALEHVLRAQKLARLESGPLSYEVLTSQMLRGILHFESNELEAARDCLRPALERLRNINGWLWLYIEGFGAACATLGALDGVDAALALIRSGEQFAEERSLLRLSQALSIMRVEALTRAGLWREATDLIEPMMSALETDTVAAPEIKTRARLASALLMAELGRPRDALAALEQIDRLYLDKADLRQRFAFHSLAMRCAFALRRYNNSVEHMLTALDLARHAGLARRARDQGGAIIEVFDWAQRSRRKLPAILASYVEDLRKGVPPASDTRKIKPDAQNFSLSPRESEIITLVAEGLSAKEIANRLDISEGTVKSHRKKIYDKLSVSTRSQAISKARDLLII